MIVLLVSGSAFAQKKETKEYNLKEMSYEDMVRVFGEQYTLSKTRGLNNSKIRESIISGNKITTVLFDYASICKPNYLGQQADLVWNGLGYGFEFGPLAAGEVTADDGSILHIVSDSFINLNQGDFSPDGTIKWGWWPKPGFVDTTQDEIARLGIRDENGDGKPDSWPESWYSQGAGKYIWPAFLGDEATAPDEEVYYVVDDFQNAEYPEYSPFLNDTTKKGLGLDMEVRVLQFNNGLAEDIMFLVYKVTNASDKELSKLYFGMHGDPHVGGSSDYSDDRADFIGNDGNTVTGPQNISQKARSMVYCWDEDNKGIGQRVTGYFGWKFLESPSNDKNAEDDDQDGIIDESPFNSAGRFLKNEIPSYINDMDAYVELYGAHKDHFYGDEDGDWNPETDDVGIDGIGPESDNYPGPDFGEGDGKPSQGWYSDLNGNGAFDPEEVTTLSEERAEGQKWAGSEPNFGMRDVSESDQLGLTAFTAAVYGNSTNVPKEDDKMWEWLSSDSIKTDQELIKNKGDNVFNFGTGPMVLKSGESQRFSMAILFGNDLDDLILNAKTSTDILDADYRFATPPDKPNVTAVAGDGRVTLYWDTKAEESIEPLTGKKDFQGYKIYRSRDYTFSDLYKITDGNGNPFLAKPMVQYDLDDSLSGYSKVEYAGRAVKYFLGNNTGLVHEFVDSTVTNGVKYFYAVVAYDSGIEYDDYGSGIPPSETQMVIERDPITTVLTYDVNTVEVIPNGKASGLVDASAGIDGTPELLNSNSTGKLAVKIYEENKVEDKLFFVKFSDEKTYSVYDSTGIKESFVSKDTVFVALSKQNIELKSVKVYDSGKNLVDPSKYIVKDLEGKIKGAYANALPKGEVYNVEYTYYPVKDSKLVNSEDYNPTFDGMRLFVKADQLDLDLENSSWNKESENTIVDSIQWSSSNKDYVGSPHTQYRTDWEVRWLDVDTLADGSWTNVGDTAMSTFGKQVVCPFEIYNVWETDENGNQIKGNFLVHEDPKSADAKNGRWDWGEAILLRPTDAKEATVSYFMTFKLPSPTMKLDTVEVGDTIRVDTLEIPADIKLPKKGDVYTVKTTKPFREGDIYKFETKALEMNNTNAKAGLDDIYVVPNPYVAYSVYEEPGRTSDKRGDRVLQFHNLPPQCTIRVYTVVGDLVQTINKDDNSSIATWDLLSFEGQRIAYGIYIFHVDVPGVGEKIGRFAVIK